MSNTSKNSCIKFGVPWDETSSGSPDRRSQKRPGYVDQAELQWQVPHALTPSEELVTEALRHFRLPLDFLKSSKVSGDHRLPDHIAHSFGATHGEEIIVQELPLDLGEDTANTCPRPVVKGPKPVFERFRSKRCRADAWTSCEMAKVENALNYARNAASRVEDVANIMLTSTSGNRLSMWNKAGIFKRFFGGYDYQQFLFTDEYRLAILKRLRNMAEDCRLSQQHFLKVRRQINGCNRNCEEGRTAYTNWEVVHRTYLCPEFFKNSSLDDPCRGARLLIHEFGHKDGIIGDPVYGRMNSIALAAQNDIFFVHAERNAENYAYFFMNLLHDPYLLLDSTETSWCTVWQP